MMDYFSPTFIYRYWRGYPRLWAASAE